MGQAEAGGGLMQKVGVYGEGEEAAVVGGLGYESGGSEFVGVVMRGAAVVAAVHDAVKDGACGMGWISQYQAQ